MCMCFDCFLTTGYPSRVSSKYRGSLYNVTTRSLETEQKRGKRVAVGLGQALARSDAEGGAAVSARRCGVV